MIQNELKIKNIASIGEEIGLELGQQMVNAYHHKQESDVNAYIVGREIIEKILNQPGCLGIKFYDAINEYDQKVLVYVGVDENGNSLITYNVVNNLGNIGSVPGIVANRGVIKPGTKSLSDDENTWFVID